MKRFVLSTPTGFRVYGTYSCIMDFDKHGQVTYSNVKQGCLEYMAMLRTYVNSPYFVSKEDTHHEDCPAIDGFACHCDELFVK